MKSMNEYPSLQDYLITERPRDPSPTTMNHVWVGKGSRGLSAFVDQQGRVDEKKLERTSNFIKPALNRMEKELIWSLVAVRVMTRDQIKWLWYRNKTVRAVNWKLQQLKNRRLVDCYMSSVVPQALWTFTAAGLDALLETLATYNQALPVDPPRTRQLKDMTVRHQLFIAEAYVRLMSLAPRGFLWENLQNCRWQDGSRLRLTHEKGYDPMSLFPDVWLGNSWNKDWLAYLEMDMGTEDGKVLAETVQRYERILQPRYRKENFPVVIYICPSEKRREFISRTIQSVGSGIGITPWIRAVTLEDSANLLRRKVLDQERMELTGGKI